ncbi:MAG TPA: GAF domain-containing sensor histidine kinase [Promineifilum sp.]|nr:GAF domain-containing sensor histidine kinase [Promineifilum sp.]
MAFLQEIIALLSRPPGSVIFHLLTLFALQVVLALAVSRWRRDPNDEAARRMALAAGGMLAARLLLLLVALFVDQDPERARVVLPPLEQAIDTATALLLVWGLAAFALDRPRLADGVLLVSLVVVAVLFLFFFQDWQSRATLTSAYIGTVQAYVWGVLQMVILAVGLVWLLVDRAARLSLRPIIVAVALLAHVANFFNYPEIIPSGTEVVYWLRLGYLVAFPLWAVLAYREGMRGLVTLAEAERAQSAQVVRNLRLSTGVIAARIPEVRLEGALDMVVGLAATQFAAIGLIDEKNPQRVLFNHTRPAAQRDAGYGHVFNLSDHPAFRLAYEQQRGIELLPRGVGARQVHDLSQQFNVGALGPVFVEPLIVANQCFGFLFLAAPPSAADWADRDRAIVPGVAAFLAQAIANSRRLESETPARRAPAPPPRLPEADAERERLIVELAEARRQQAVAEERARQAESMAVLLQQREPGRPTTARPQVAQSAVAPTVESTVASILPILRRKKLTLDLSMAADLPLVAVKETVLRQLTLSLLENACRASAEDSGVVVRAEAVAAEDGATNGGKATSSRLVHVAFSDSGGGVAADQQGYVFDSRHHLAGGQPISGLGDTSANLAVVQKLAQASGGDLVFESQPGVGATFTLRLPAAELRPWSLLTPPARPGQTDETSRPAGAGEA